MKILHLADRFNLCDGCARHVLLLIREQSRSHEIRAVVGSGEAADRLSEENIPVTVLPSMLHEARSLRGFARGASELGRILRAFSPDLVHAHHFYAANLVRWNPRNLGRPLVLTVHGNVKEYGKLPHYLGDRIIAVSRSTEQQIRNRRPGVAGRIRYVPNASHFLDRYDSILREREDYRRLLLLKESHLILLFVGRLGRMKGLDLLLEAASRLAGRAPSILVAVGEPDPDFSPHIPERLRFIHVPPIPDVRPFFELSDIVVLPSRSEGLPLTLIEAGLAGKCVVASAVDGIPEIIQHEETGLLVRADDAAELHAMLERAAEDPALRSRLGMNLREFVQRRHTVPRMAERVEEIYGELTSPRSRRSAV